MHRASTREVETILHAHSVHDPYRPVFGPDSPDALGKYVVVREFWGFHAAECLGRYPSSTRCADVSRPNRHGAGGSCGWQRRG